MLSQLKSRKEYLNIFTFIEKNKHLFKKHLMQMTVIGTSVCPSRRHHFTLLLTVAEHYNTTLLHNFIKL